MVRVKRGFVARRRRKRLLKKASGYFGSRHRLFRIAKESVNRALSYSYRDRKVRKRFFRKLWIIRINAMTREYGISYSNFIYSLKKQKCKLNRKVLSILSLTDSNVFFRIIENIKSHE